MINIDDMIKEEIENGYGDENAQSKVCQDLILKAISESSLNRNVTIKGGVVMRGKTNNSRRATQDVDLDFIRYSLSDEAIDTFVRKLNCIEGLSIEKVGAIKELRQQDYKGKRIYVKITDSTGFTIENKIDLGVHTMLDIEQEEFCFDIAYDDDGASLLVNSNEQMLAEKLKSLLRFGVFSTRYKDIFDIYYLSQFIDPEKMDKCFNTFVFDDEKMRENDYDGIEKRLSIVFNNKRYTSNLNTRDVNWLDLEPKVAIEGILEFIRTMKNIKHPQK